MALVAADHPPFRVQERPGPLPVAVSQVEYEVLHVHSGCALKSLSMILDAPCRGQDWRPKRYRTAALTAQPRATMMFANKKQGCGHAKASVAGCAQRRADRIGVHDYGTAAGGHADAYQHRRLRQMGASDRDDARYVRLLDAARRGCLPGCRPRVPNNVSRALSGHGIHRFFDSDAHVVRGKLRHNGAHRGCANGYRR